MLLICIKWLTIGVNAPCTMSEDHFNDSITNQHSGGQPRHYVGKSMRKCFDLNYINIVVVSLVIMLKKLRGNVVSVAIIALTILWLGNNFQG
jgi:hypothetical protein